jgi:hypothetical protein
MYVDWFNFASTSFTGGGFLMSDKWRFSTSFALFVNKGDSKITELRTILQRESQNS